MTHILLILIYLAFISLGLPDPLLGAAWPSMFGELGVPVSYAGIISMIIAAGTIISSLLSDRINKKLGTGRVTAISVATTAIALLGFSFSGSFWMLCLWAIPYGLGAGSVDAALNNYVAIHYAGRHMSWLHCMWGVGTVIGPVIMSAILTGGAPWNSGYLAVSVMQIVLSAVLVISLPLWKKNTNSDNTTETSAASKPLSLIETVRIPGALAVMLSFFCYCALEQTTILWISSYMVLGHGMATDDAAGFATLFFLGITLGRFLSGFLTVKLNDRQLTRLGIAVMSVGCLVLLLPLGKLTAMIGVALIGLGGAPIYPSLIHATPIRFGVDRSQALIGVQMASAYVGTCLVPPLFGLIAQHVSVKLLPLFLSLFAVLIILAHEWLIKTTDRRKT